MAVIFPKLGQERDVAIVLLSLADDPRDVSTNTDAGLAFVVPEALHQRYLEYKKPTEQTPAMVEQAIRRPGRPRKATTSEAGSE